MPDRTLNLDEYDGRHFELWSSTPAVVWTADRPQERGIHVHVFEGEGPRRIEDDTFGTVMYQGKPLDRDTLWAMMREHTLLKRKVRSRTPIVLLGASNYRFCPANIGQCGNTCCRISVSILALVTQTRKIFMLRQYGGA